MVEKPGQTEKKWLRVIFPSFQAQSISNIQAEVQRRTKETVDWKSQGGRGMVYYICVLEAERVKQLLKSFGVNSVENILERNIPEEFLRIEAAKK